MKDKTPTDEVWRSTWGSSRKRLMATLVIAAIPMLGLGFLLTGSRGMRSASLAPLLYAFAAGMVASVSPCGVLMLPTYMFFYQGSQEESSSRVSRALRALLIAGVTASGLIVIFLAAGSLVGIGSQWLTASSPYTGLFLGAAMVGLGIWLLVTRRTLGILAATRMTVSPHRSIVNAFLFGIAYALGSLSCSLPVFLGVASNALTSGGMLQSIGQFLGYALGMGSIIFGVAVGSVLFRRTMDRWLQSLSRRAHRLSVVLLIVIGAYSIIYRVAVVLLAAPGAS
jgi:cytochrome c-type biogenesis protein